MRQYLDLVKFVLDNGVEKQDRTGTGTLSVFGYQMRFDLQKGFPLLTTKKLHWKSICHELLWFISGNTNVKYLNDNGVTIWNEWANENGDCPNIYPKQWTAWEKHIFDSEIIHDLIDYKQTHSFIYEKKFINQIANVIESIKTNPDSRRHIVSAWNVAELDEMALPPCHMITQFYVVNNKLSCLMTSRGLDTFLGLPFNIASYALLTHMVAQVCNLQVGELILSIGDAHIYLNHIEQCKLQLTRQPLPLCQLKLNPEIKDIFEFKYEDIEIANYQAHPHIKGKVAV